MGNLFPGTGEVAGPVRRVLNRHPGTRRVRRVMVRASLASIAAASLAAAAFPAPAGAKVSELSGQPGDRALPAAAAPGPGWSVTRSPNPLTRTGQLFWVSCPAADSCVAVGTLVGVSCTWPAACTAVGGPPPPTLDPGTSHTRSP